MSTGLPRFSEIIAGYPEDAPQYGDELLAADAGQLDGLARDLRRHFTLAVQSAKSITFSSAEEAKRRLELGHVLPLARKWVTYALDERRRRIMKPSRDGGSYAHRVTTRRVPTAEHLAREAPLPEGGTYLVIYGGSPEVVAVRDHQGGGVAEDLAALRATAPVADVVFWHLESGKPPALYSLAAGRGQRGTDEAVEFPDQAYLAVARGDSPPTATGTPTGETNPGGTS